MKKTLAILFTLLSVLAWSENPINSPYYIPAKQIRLHKPIEESSYHPYLGAGVSVFVYGSQYQISFPYSANAAFGARQTIPNHRMGFDLSINYTATFVSHYFFGKGMLPVYLNKENPEESAYIAPYLCVGFNQYYTFGTDLKNSDSGLLAINGIAFGKNYLVNDKMQFFQVSANISRLDLPGSWMLWPTLTFQYGMGF